MALGTRLKQRRLELKMSQATLANTVGRSQTYIQSLERRDSRKTDCSYKIAKALGVSHDWLVLGNDLSLVTSDDAPYIPSLDAAAIEWSIVFCDKYITKDLMKVRDSKWKAKIFMALYDLYLEDKTIKKLKDETIKKIIQL